MNQKQQIRIIVIVVCATILFSSGGGTFLSLESVGYATGYQGIRAGFAGIEWETIGATGHLKGRHNITGNDFNFDADAPLYHAPNLRAEMTSAFIPESSVKPAWVFPDFWKKTQYIKNPIETYTWNLPNPNDPNGTIAYVMEEWILTMYVSITAEWDDSPTVWVADKEAGGGVRYTNTRVWFELDMEPLVYFEGSDTAYFGIAKVAPSEVSKGKFGTTAEDYTPTSKFSVTPESATSNRYLYFGPYGAPQDTQVTPQTYKGRILEPSIFRDRMFFYVSLNDFGTEATAGFPTKTYKGDAVTWGFDIHVFAVGEWRVQDIDEIPEDWGREGRQQLSWSDLLARALGNPRNQFWLLLGLVALVGLGLAIFAPWALFALFGVVGLFKGNTKGTGYLTRFAMGVMWFVLLSAIQIGFGEQASNYASIVILAGIIGFFLLLRGGKK